MDKYGKSGLKLSAVLALAVFAIQGNHAAAQKVEEVDGVRVVHNAKGGKWGKHPRLSLELVQTLGELEAKDPNFAFYVPADIAVDRQGNMYVLDSGNHRIQKFSPDGKYLATFGRQGQGPAEFYFPESLEIEDKGFLYVSDPNNQRIVVLTPEGKDHKVIKFTDEGIGEIAWLSAGELAMHGGRGFIKIDEFEKKAKALPKLVKILDLEGRVVREVGEQQDFKDLLLTRAANSARFAVDGIGHVYFSFTRRNCIEKYAPSGKLLWRADRELNYSLKPKSKGKIERSGGSVSITSPDINDCSRGIAVDGAGRVWVVTLDRQLKKEEQVGMGITMSNAGGQQSISYKVEGNVETQKTDAYKLEVFDPDGVLLGEIPLPHFVDGIYIHGDRLFLLDKLRGCKFYEYRISNWD
jgi:sugar lactone lactonase YvrE